jgi:hypothetical protein
MKDIEFSAKLAKLLKESGSTVSVTAAEEDGDRHILEVTNNHSSLILYTEYGRLMYVGP